MFRNESQRYRLSALKRWVPWLVFAAILALGLIAGLTEHGIAVRQGRLLAGPGLDQRLAALQRLRGMDHLARAARRELVKVLEDHRIPPQADSARKFLLSLRPGVMAAPTLDLARFSVSSQAERILVVIAPLDYAWFRRTVLASDARTRFREVDILIRIGIWKPQDCLPALQLLQTLLEDPVTAVRRGAFAGLFRVWSRASRRGVLKTEAVCVRMIAGAVFTLDPQIGPRAAFVVYKLGLADDFVTSAFARAWAKPLRPVASRS